MMCTAKRLISSNIIFWAACLLTLLVLGCPSKKQEQKSEKSDSNSVKSEAQTPASKEIEPAITKEQAKQATAKKIVESFKSKQAKKSTESSLLIKNMPPQPVAPSEPVTPEDLIKQTAAAMDSNDPKIRLDGMESLASEELSDPSVLPVISKGLRDPDEQVREASVRALSFVNTPEADDLLMKALNDTNEDVRRAALETASEQETNIRWNVLQAAIASPYQDIKEDAVANLIGLTTPNAIDILIWGLKDPDADFRQEVNSALNLLISQEFSSYDEAAKWWNQNKNNYDENLFEKEPAQ